MTALLESLWLLLADLLVPSKALRLALLSTWPDARVSW